MGCYDRAEIIGTNLLYKINNAISKEDIGLYRDVGLGIFRYMSVPEVERKKKDLIRIFKSNGLSITVKTNLKVADFLDIHFEIIQGIYQPYKKSNDEPLDINKNFHHPPTVIKQIPKAISQRISDISWSKEIYDQNIRFYKDVLKHSGYDNISLPYNSTQHIKDRWFIPPFSMNVKMNVGKTFLKLLQRHLPKLHPMDKVFNHNTVKISYCCMRNMETVISSHNKQILNPSKEYFRCN